MGLRTLLTQVRRTAETIPVAGCLPPWLAFTRGNHYHVDPVEGSDQGNNGSLYKPFKTISRAFAVAVANQNDIIFFHSRGNSKAYCSETLSSQLNWNKDMVHLIAVNSGIHMSPRARIECSAAYDSAAPIFKVSANNCYMSGFEVILESTGTTPLGAMSVTGSRLRFDRFHVCGFGSAAQDILGAYSLLLDGAEEVLFHECTVGSDRLAQGSYANSQILLAASSSPNKNIMFRDSEIRLVSTHATNHLFLRVPASTLDGALVFRNTVGINSQSRNVAGSELTYGAVIASNAGGDVIFDAASGLQATDCNSTDAGNVYGSTAANGILIPLTK